MSKTLVVLVIGLFVVGCGKHAPPTNDTSGRGKTVESTPTTTAKPVKELTAEEKVVGIYEYYEEVVIQRRWPKQAFGRFVFLENGIVEGYKHRANHPSPWYKTEEGKWKLTKEGELHDTYSNGNVLVFSIDKDGSITIIARIDAVGKREEAPEEKQVTFKKIK